MFTRILLFVSDLFLRPSRVHQYETAYDMVNFTNNTGNYFSFFILCFSSGMFCELDYKTKSLFLFINK